MFVLTLCPTCTSVVVLPPSSSGSARCRSCGAVVRPAALPAKAAERRLVGAGAEAAAA